MKHRPAIDLRQLAATTDEPLSVAELRERIARGAAQSAKGRRRKAQGTRWEKTVEEINRFYATHRWVGDMNGVNGRYRSLAEWLPSQRPAAEAVISRCPPPAVGPNGQARYTGSGDCDFAGRWRSTPIMYDAKTCTREYLEIDEKQLHQPKLLLEFGAEAGAVACFLVLDPERGVCGIVDRDGDLRRLAEGLSVRIRKGDEWLIPTLPEATLLELARGLPRYDYLRYFRGRTDCPV